MARSPRAPTALTTSGEPHGLYVKPAGAGATNAPLAVVRTVRIEA